MPYSFAAKNLMLNALARGTAPATPITHVSAHTADPGDTGASEVTGGTPAYARTPIAWNAATAGTIDDSTNGAVLNVPGGVTVTHIGFWSAVTAGTFLASRALAAPEVFGAQGTYTVTDADLDLNNP